MNAVIKTGGKQYIVKEGDIVNIEKLEAQPGEIVSFEALLTFDGDKVFVGTPIVAGNVSGEVVDHGRAQKISVVKYKAKSRYTRRSGHRQHFTRVKITKVA